ncbi:MAG: hypothetical protein ACPGRF_05160 [Miltoncostaeaceae bacterium]
MAIVERDPAAGGVTTVRDGGDEPPPRGLGAGLGVTVLAIGMAVAFGAGAESAVETAVRVVDAQSQAPTAGAPRTTPGGRPLARAFGVTFPDLAPRLGWRPTGRRDDVVDGRRVATVQYGRAGRRLAYSIVDGPPLLPPPGAATVPVRGPRAYQFGTGGRVAVLATRGGHPVVVSGTGVPRVAIVRAARAG